MPPGSSSGQFSQPSPQQQLPPQQEQFAPPMTATFLFIPDGYIQQRNNSPWAPVSGQEVLNSGRLKGRTFQDALEDSSYSKWMLDRSATIKEASLKRYVKFLCQHYMKYDLKDRNNHGNQEPIRPQV